MLNNHHDNADAFSYSLPQRSSVAVVVVSPLNGQ